MSSRRYMPALLLLFVGSGCAALIYEIVWFQLLQLVIGSSAISLGVLLGTFMGGMCLGSLLLPRFIGGDQHPLRVYAYLELGIGALRPADPVRHAAARRASTPRSARPAIVGLVLRGVAAAICLLPPTLLMGATLPAISRWVKSTPEGMSWLGFFYGGNIAGGVLGCLLAGFYLLRVYDMAIATYVAVALNVVVAGIALALARTATSREPAVAETRAETTIEHRRPRGGAWAIYIAIGLSGLTALGSEVLWTRTLSLLFGATAYTFSLILAVFLFGLGIGSSIGSAHRRPHRRVRGWRSAGARCCCAPRWRGRPTCSRSRCRTGRSTRRSRPSPWYNFQLDFVRALWAMLPARDSLGRQLPARARLGRRRTQGSGAAGRRRLRRQHARRDRRRRRRQPAAHHLARHAALAAGA